MKKLMLYLSIGVLAYSANPSYGGGIRKGTNGQASGNLVIAHTDYYSFNQQTEVLKETANSYYHMNQEIEQQITSTNAANRVYYPPFSPPNIGTVPTIGAVPTFATVPTTTVSWNPFSYATGGQQLSLPSPTIGNVAPGLVPTFATQAYPATTLQPAAQNVIVGMQPAGIQFTSGFPGRGLFGHHGMRAGGFMSLPVITTGF